MISGSQPPSRLGGDPAKQSQECFLEVDTSMPKLVLGWRIFDSG